MQTPQPPRGAKPRPRHRMIDRMAEMLDLTARRRAGVSLTEYARLLDAPLSSVQGLANGLVATGYLEEHDRVYTLGPAPYYLTRLQGAAPSDVVSHEHLVEIHDRTGLTTVLAIAVGSDLYYIDHASTSPRFGYLAENYVRRSLLRASSGWLLLAGMERRDLWAQLGAAREQDLPLVERFLEELPAIEADGFVIAPGVSEVEIDGVATQVVVDGRTVAAVACIGSHDEVSASAENVVEVLREFRDRWQGSATG